MKVDIFAKDRQPLSSSALEQAAIVSPSAEGWGSKAARVFLRQRRYIGALRIVSADTDARLFGIEIEPDRADHPTNIAPTFGAPSESARSMGLMSG